jgi:hypothetical protein
MYMSEEAISYFSKYWTTHKDQCYVVEGKIEEGDFSIICPDGFLLIEDENTWKAVARKMIEAGVKVISHQDYSDKVMREWEAKYDQWVRDGKPHIDIHTKHDLNSSNSE